MRCRTVTVTVTSAAPGELVRYAPVFQFSQQHSAPTGVSAAVYRQFHTDTAGCCSSLAYCQLLLDMKAWTTILAAPFLLRDDQWTTDRRNYFTAINDMVQFFYGIFFYVISHSSLGPIIKHSLTVRSQMTMKQYEQ